MRFNFSEVKKDDKRDKYFRTKGQYLNFNGKIFSKTITVVSIWIFQGLQPIYSLKCFPFKYYPNTKEDK